jgi:hypothetical protein
MDIYVKLSSDLGSDLGPNFSISADVGSVTSSSATKSELLSGKTFTLSDNTASSITISSIGACSNSSSFNIDKDSATCFATSAFGYQPGNTRPTDENGAIAPFNTETLDINEINELLYASDGGQFSISIFGKNIIFFIETVLSNEDGSTTKFGTCIGDGGLNSGEYDMLFSSSSSVEMQIYFYDAGVAYTIEGIPGSTFTVKEWAISDLFSGGY